MSQCFGHLCTGSSPQQVAANHVEPQRRAVGHCREEAVAADALIRSHCLLPLVRRHARDACRASIEPASEVRQWLHKSRAIGQFTARMTNSKVNQCSCAGAAPTGEVRQRLRIPRACRLTTDDLQQVEKMQAILHTACSQPVRADSCCAYHNGKN